MNNYSLDSTYNLGDIFISKFTNKSTPTPYSCQPLTNTLARNTLNIKDILLKNGYKYSTIYEVPNIPLQDQDKRLEEVVIYIYGDLVFDSAIHNATVDNENITIAKKYKYCQIVPQLHYGGGLLGSISGSYIPRWPSMRKGTYNLVIQPQYYWKTDTSGFAEVPRNSTYPSGYYLEVSATDIIQSNIHICDKNSPDPSGIFLDMKVYNSNCVPKGDISLVLNRPFPNEPNGYKSWYDLMIDISGGSYQLDIDRGIEPYIHTSTECNIITKTLCPLNVSNRCNLKNEPSINVEGLNCISNTPAPCNGKLSKHQCTAWKNFYEKIKNPNIQKECPNLSTNPCISCSPVTCSGGNITELDSTVGGFNFSDISNFSNLESLYLSINNISGDLIDLSKFSRLKYLDIHSSTDDNKNINITGNFSDLSSLQQLEILILSSLDKTNIIGKLEDLVYNKNLNLLIISDSEGTQPDIKLTGNLNNLAKLHKLQVITLLSKNITGNLNDISGLSDLNTLDLQYSSNISGNLNILNNFKKIDTINIPLVKNGLDGSCNDISNILRTMRADACALNVKDYDNCIKDYSSYCTFINPKE